MQTRTVTPEKVNIKDPITGEGQKGPYKFWPVGIQIKGQWYNGAVNKEEDLPSEGKETTLNFFQKEYKGQMQWKFKIPSQQDIILARLEALEKRVSDLEITNKKNDNFP